MTSDINNMCKMCKTNINKSNENICKICKSQIDKEAVFVHFLSLL